MPPSDSNQNPDTIVHPSFGTVRILRPYAGFEDNYQGIGVNRPIVLSERGRALDERAGTAGYDDELVPGLSVAMGQRVVFDLPQFLFDPNARIPPKEYIYVFIWRWRNLAGWRLARVAYHFPRTEPGAPDALANPNFLVPAAMNSVVYQQAESGGPQIQNLATREDIRVGSASIQLPINQSGNNGIYQQGVQTGWSSPIYAKHEMAAVGDEVVVLVYREATGDANWDFAGVDQNFAGVFGSDAPDGLGVYVTFGSAP